MAVLKRTKAGAISALAAIAAAVTLSMSAPAAAQQKAPAATGKGEQFFPVLVYRTGAYAPNGTPWANGYVDYLKLVNAQGGINGVTITFEECETGYATDRGVECYERLKGKGPTGATLFHPLSTGITFAVTDKTFADKIPIITAGYGRADSVEGEVFPYNFPLLGTYWSAADILVQHVAKTQRWLRQAEGQEDHARVSRFTVRQGADSAADRAFEAARLRTDDDSGHASWRRAESGLAADSPKPSRLCVSMGLGRDEFDRRARGGGHRLPA